MSEDEAGGPSAPETAPAAGEKPLISCLMVSRGNIFPARLAIACYSRQTYPNRELVIVSAQPNSPLSEFVTNFGDPSIRYIESPAVPLGELRNRSVAEARGSLLCTWDDDDLYHPRRLELQALDLAADAAAHFLSRVLIWWPERRLLGISGARPWENTMLVRREALPQYPSLPMREDTHVVSEIESRHRIVGSNLPELYCYVIHSRNTCDSAHFENIFEDADWVYPDYDAELARLSAHYPLRWYTDRLLAKAMDRGDGITIPDQGGPLVICSGKTFGDEEVRIDGIHFKDCTFKGTQLLYLGGRIPIFEDCDLGAANINFAGSASNTVHWLRQLKQAGMIGDI
jgi:glycosyltransferase involved in cell wall biosynthesis